MSLLGLGKKICRGCGMNFGTGKKKKGPEKRRAEGKTSDVPARKKRGLF